MKYQVIASLLFSSEDEARDFYHDCQIAITKAIKVNPGEQNEETSRIQLLENHHDDQPNQPCEELAGKIL